MFLGVIQAYREQCYFREFGDLASLRNYLGAEPVLTKVGFVKKTKVNPNTLAGTVKARIIVDSLESKVSLAAKRTHKSNLPLATMTAKGLVGLMNCDEYKNPNCDLDLFIADVSDAFWIVPLRKCERRFFVIKFRGVYFVFTRTAQGSRGAPLSWAAVGAVLA